MPRKNDEYTSRSHISSVLNDNVSNSITKEQNASNIKTAARKRWKILAKALFKDDREEVADVSVRRFTSFNVLAPTFIDGEWYEYSTPDKKYSINVRRLPGSLTARDLMGFNNTGNICVWPSEETLAVYITSNLEIFKDKTILELGGGMSCMAGLIVAKYANPLYVNVTDGNLKSIENVKAILENNSLTTNISCSVLQWETVRKNHPRKDISDCYDIILVADCLFFDEVREDLIRTIRTYLSDSGVTFIMAPQRGDTLDRFISTSESFGFKCKKLEKYDDLIWERHLELLKSNIYYDPSLHYPILLKMTKITSDAFTVIG